MPFRGFLVFRGFCSTFYCAVRLILWQDSALPIQRKEDRGILRFPVDGDYHILTPLHSIIASRFFIGEEVHHRANPKTQWFNGLA